MTPAAIACIQNQCHPERSLAASKASHQTESKDPYPPSTAQGVSKSQ